MTKSTKPKSATSFKETAFGILPRSEIVKLEAEGIKKAQQYIIKLSNRKTKITQQIIRVNITVGLVPAPFCLDSPVQRLQWESGPFIN